jgi:hydroxylaminobenzene mutase
MNKDNISDYALKLIRYGLILFLLGLFTGFSIPALQNPRMGLSSHLEATMNGMLLILFGLIWNKLFLSENQKKLAFYLALFGTFTNWLTTLLAGVWGAGADMMPIAGQNMHGTLWQEIFIKFGLISLSLSMVVVCMILIFGITNKVK